MMTRALGTFLLLAALVALIACFQRTDGTSHFRRGALPGGDETSPNSGHRHLVKIDFVSKNPSWKLNECEGDCDRSSQCADGLVCFEKPPNTEVPGCKGGRGDSSKTDYCVRKELAGGGNTNPTPTPAPGGSNVIKRVGNNLGITLGMCQGDCDSDNDCQGSLVCYQRRSRYQSVPGCLGGNLDSTKWDYCVPPGQANNQPNPAPAPSPSQPTTGLFRLKLYWQNGYYWQEERRERKWCMMYSYDGLPGNGKCWYGRERKSCRDDQMYIAKCGNDIRQKFRFIKLSGGEVQIQVGNGKNRCVERDGKQIFLRPCNSGDDHQRWFAPRGSFGGPRFELSQRRFSSYCMTQDHHPSQAKLLSCSDAALHEASTTRRAIGTCIDDRPGSEFGRDSSVAIWKNNSYGLDHLND